MTAGTYVQEFAKTAVENPDRDIETLKAELLAVDSAKNSLYSIEAHSAAQLEARAHKLRHDLKFANKPYKRLSLEPLGWWKKWHATPIFAIYSLFQSTVSICSPDSWNVTEGNRQWLDPRLPGPLEEIYRKHANNLPRNTLYTSTFQGVIPKSVKEAIAEAKPFFTEGNGPTRIYLIGEADWKTKQMPLPPVPAFIDPLVVGWDERDLWLISHFDLTPLERYVMEEFPALPDRTNNMMLPGRKIVEKEL